MQNLVVGTYHMLINNTKICFPRFSIRINVVVNHKNLSFIQCFVVFGMLRPMCYDLCDVKNTQNLVFRT